MNGESEEFDKDQFYKTIEVLIRKEIGKTGFDNSKQKLEDFDFAELVSDLTNSITDQLYREFFPPAKTLYAEHVEAGDDINFKNDLDVHDLVKGLKNDLVDDIKERVAISLRLRMQNELEEQYHPKAGSSEAKIDKRLKDIRKIAVFGYYCISMIVMVIVALVATESLSIVTKTGMLIWDGVQNLRAGEIVGAVDRTLLNKIIFSILSVLDLLLLASLVIMVLIGGYENTVSRIGTSHDVPAWFGSLGITDLKIKVAASIVIISSIHLLTQFMLIEPTMPSNITPNIQKIMACTKEKKELSKVYNESAEYSNLTGHEIGQIEKAFEICQLAELEKDKLTVLKEQKINNADDYFEASYSKTALMWTSIVHAVFVLAALALAYMGKLSNHDSLKNQQKARDAVLSKRESNEGSPSQ